MILCESCACSCRRQKTWLPGMSLPARRSSGREPVSGVSYRHRPQSTNEGVTDLVHGRNCRNSLLVRAVAVPWEYGMEERPHNLRLSLAAIIAMACMTAASCGGGASGSGLAPTPPLGTSGLMAFVALDGTIRHLYTMRVDAAGVGSAPT